MALLGYYRTNASLVDTETFPKTASLNDTLYGVYQIPDSPTRMSQLFKYKLVGLELNWAAEGAPTALSSTNPNLAVLEKPYLNVFETYGMGTLPLYYAFVDPSDLTGWYADPPQSVGNDTIQSSKLHVYSSLNGNSADGTVPTTGLLPVYIKSLGGGAEGTIVGVGTAVYTGVWRVLWYKMNIVSNAIQPTVAYNTETIVANNEFKMVGNTTDYRLRVCKASDLINGVNTCTLVNGSYSSDEGHTTYSLENFTGSNVWVELTLLNPLGDPVYYVTNGIDATLKNLITVVDTGLANRVEISIADTPGVDGIIGNVEHLAEGTSRGIRVTAMTPAADGTVSKTQKDLVFPTVNAALPGLMSPASFGALNTAISDIARLQNLGGFWVGNYPTREALFSAYSESGFTANETNPQPNDFVYVESDSAYANKRTMYIVIKFTPGGVEKRKFIYAQTETVEAPVVATNVKMGLVLSTPTNGAAGSVSVSGSGVMSVVGYDDLLARLTTLEATLATLEGRVGTSAKPTLAPLNGKSLTDAVLAINEVFRGVTGVTINHIL